MSVQHGQQSRGSGSRRGSALLIVIGTLALIAVFAAIYITIGQGDRRAASTVRTRNDAQNIQNTFAEYFAGMIANDRVDVYTQRTLGAADVIYNREITDAPYTDWSVRSGSNTDALRFNPTGRHTFKGLSIPLSDDDRVPYDPWLASTRPTYLGNPDPALRPFSTGFSSPHLKSYLDNRDWMQITNMAPDGRFVNLFNLRPQTKYGGRGGFNSEPGYGTTSFGPGPRTRRMSTGLSLLRLRNPGNPNSPLIAQTDGFWLPGQDLPQGTLDPNVPAHWTMYQRFMFFPMSQPFMMYDQDDTLADWSSPDYGPYQYADADGDGMADSRWFELTSAQTDWGTSTSPRDDIKRLYDSREFRVFAAARAIDLSSLVNVNTATDGLVPPTSEDPLGVTPAEIDLRRILTMQDAASMFASGNPNPTTGAFLPLSFASLHRPTIYRGTGNDNDQQHLFERSEADYSTYTQRGQTVGTQRLLQPDENAILLGRFAYDALRMGINREYGLTGQFFGNDYFGNGQPVEWLVEDLVQYPRDPKFNGYGTSTAPDMISAETRRDQWEKIGRIDPSRAGISVDSEYGAGFFGMDDLAEILTYHGINDPDVTTRLEGVVSGRLINDGEAQDRLSPMLSNRPLSVDRTRHGSVKGPGGDNPNRPRLIDGRIADESMTMFALSPRKLITTISGGVGLRPSMSINLYGNTPAELTALESQTSLRSAVTDAQTLFGIYSRALAGELDAAFADVGDGLWTADLSLRRTDATAAPYATMFYGHRGPEFAYRVAAHAAVNMADMDDNDDNPTVATLLIHDDTGALRTRIENLRDDAEDNTLDITSDQDAWLFPGITRSENGANGLLFEVPENSVSSSFDTDAQTLHRRAVNVYGIEAMPVISEVSSVYVYTDAPEAVGGDTDYTQLPPPGSPDSLVRTERVTIEGGIDPVNPDFLMQLLAVQLTNPFDEPINLGGLGQGALMGRKGGTPPTGSNTNNFEFLYYLEFNGRFFKLGEFQEENPSIPDGGTDYSADGGPAPEEHFDVFLNPAHEEFVYRDVTLQPGQSRVFYALAQERFDGPGPLYDSGVDAVSIDIMSTYAELPPAFDPAFVDVDGDGIAEGRDGREWTGPAEEWVQSQFRGTGVSTGGAVHMHQFDPLTGQLTELGSFSDLFSPGPAIPGVSSRVADATQIRLWRKHLSQGEESGESSLPIGGTRRNLIQNDLLVDRFAINGSLENALRTSDDEIEDTVSFEEDESGMPGTNRNDNKGLSMVRWKTQRRKDTGADAVLGGGGSDLRPLGQVGPWSIHSRRDPASTRIEHEVTSIDIPFFDLPEAETFLLDNGNLQNVNRSATERGDLEVRLSLRDLFRPGSSVVQTLPAHPGDKSEVATSGLVGNNNATKFASEFLRDGSNAAGEDLGYRSNAGATGPKPEIFNKHLWSAQRVADLLLTTGIGITYAPDPTRVVDQSVHDEEWITFPEAMAIALGYETPLASDVSADAIWYDAVLPAGTGAGGQIEYVFDDLHLSIDNFVAYIDQDMDQQYTPGTDIRRGTGAPMALSVIDSVRPMGWLTQVGDSSLPAAEQNLLALKRSAFGKININTAPPEVLRLLPGLSPSLERYHDGPTLVEEWWGNQPGLTGADLPDLSNPDSTPDIAAGIVAYRDRLTANPRVQSFDYTAPYDPTNGLNYGAFDVVGDIDDNFIDEFVDPTNPSDRGQLAGIDGLRGTPGFGSLGEVLAVTIDPDSPITNIDTLRPKVARFTAGYYGIDGDNMELAGIDTDGDMSDDDYLSLDPQVFGTSSNPDEGQVEDDYAERLAVANGILNSISVRSDYFAVWFVVQGFRESDVANLGEFDPLVPSFKKRYIMVVDRSNVTKEGQQPRILMLKEVPL